MNNSKKTRRALLSSLVALMLCFSMFVGTTMAWFTDTATTGVNTIQAGTLDIALEDAAGNSLEGKVLNFKKAEEGKDEAVLWEPGATYELDSFKIVNKGNLDIKYKVVLNGVTGDEKLLEAINFTVAVDGGAGIALKDAFSVNAEGEYAFKWEGELLANETGDASNTIAIKGHMDENAGNEYQGLSMDGVSITVFATQLASEYDSTTNQYDKDAKYQVLPTADVKTLDTLPKVTIYNTTNEVTLDKAYSFTAPTSADADYDALMDEYQYWNADFVVTTNKNVTDAVLAGQYDAFSTDWLAFEASATADTEYRLLKDAAGIAVTYQELCEKVKVFNCGLADSGASDSGATVTVELRLYETERAVNGGTGSASVDAETGRSIVIGAYSYTF